MTKARDDGGLCAGIDLRTASPASVAMPLNPNRSLQHRFFNFILETCSPAACSRLPASCPLFFLDVARYACKKTTANLLGQPTTISSGSNDRIWVKPQSVIIAQTDCSRVQAKPQIRRVYGANTACLWSKYGVIDRQNRRVCPVDGHASRCCSCGI